MMPVIRLARFLSLTVVAGLWLTSAACGRSSDSADSNGSDSRQALGSKVEGETGNAVSKQASSATDKVAGVEGLTVGGECPDVGPSADAEIVSQAAALIPIRKGLTLSHVWKRNSEDYEHECLEQVTDIDARGVLTMGSCPLGKARKMIHWVRRLCRADLRNSYLYQTTADSLYPPTFAGALKFSLSAASFADLKNKGETRHRFVGIDGDFPALNLYDDLDGILKLEGKGTYKLILNDRTVEVPTIEASSYNDSTQHRIRVKVLDDERFPFMLDYYIPSLNKFFITYTKVSFPTSGDLERQLDANKHVDIYGIYFDFDSDVLRAESEPVLREIANVLESNSGWKLTINGHTDSTGTSAFNMELSRRRSDAVRKALVERFSVEVGRLSTNGYGASQPKESNSTDIGRARNRRVELVRM